MLSSSSPRSRWSPAAAAAQRHDQRRNRGAEAPKAGRRRREAEGGGGEARRLDRSRSKPTPSGRLAYTTREATAKAGKVTIDFNNPQALTHDVAIEDSSGKTVGETELIAEGTDLDHGQPQTRHLHLLLHRPGPPRSRHGRHADRQVAADGRWETTSTLEAEVAPASVWERAYADAEAWPRWNAEIKRASLDGPLALGARAKVVFRTGLRLRFHVVEFEDGRLFTDESRLPGARMGHRHLVEPAEGGGSRLDEHDLHRGPPGAAMEAGHGAARGAGPARGAARGCRVAGATSADLRL